MSFSPMPGEVFINYRRADSGSYGALLYVDLVRYLGPGVVFMDSMSILAGADFTVELLERVRRTRVMLAVLGPTWLSGTDELGRRLIDDPDDWVRRELVVAFAAGVRVVPVLTDGARMPLEDELPADIGALARAQYRLLRAADVVSDLDRLHRDLRVMVPGLVSRTPPWFALPRPRAGPGWMPSRRSVGWFIRRTGAGRDGIPPAASGDAAAADPVA